MQKYFAALIASTLVAAATSLFEPQAIEAQRGGMPKEFDYHYYMEQTAPVVGAPALPMHGKTPEGDEVDLKQFLGKWVMIEFGSYT